MTWHPSRNSATLNGLHLLVPTRSHVAASVVQGHLFSFAVQVLRMVIGHHFDICN